MKPNRPPDVPDSAVTACLLAGGKGERLGGKNKGLQCWPANAKPLVSSVIERLRPQLGDMRISANADLDAYAAFGFPVVVDLPEFASAGPLAGVVSAGEHANSEWLQLAAVDCPCLPQDLVARLISANSDIAVPFDGERLQPLAMLLRRDLLTDMRAFLASGQRRVFSWLDRHDFATVDFSDQPRAFINLNTEADFNRYDR